MGELIGFELLTVEAWYCGNAVPSSAGTMVKGDQGWQWEINKSNLILPCILHAIYRNLGGLSRWIYQNNWAHICSNVRSKRYAASRGSKCLTSSQLLLLVHCTCCTCCTATAHHCFRTSLPCVYWFDLWFFTCLCSLRRDNPLNSWGLQFFSEPLSDNFPFQNGFHSESLATTMTPVYRYYIYTHTCAYM